MPPNSRFDRIDKFDRRPSKQTDSNNSFAQGKKNFKFKNLQLDKNIKYLQNDSTKQNFNYLKLLNILKQKLFDLKNLGMQSIYYKFDESGSDHESNMIGTWIKNRPLSKFWEGVNKCLVTPVSSKYIFVFLSSIFIYLPCLYNEFVFDDIPAIVHNKIVQQPTPFTNFYHLFTTDYWGTSIQKEQSHKSYRPFTVFTFRLNFWFGKLDPFGYQLINIILHCLVSMLNYRFISNFLRNQTAFIAALLFAVHPIHVDAVASVVGRAELLSALFILVILNLRLHLKKPINLPILFILTLFGLLSKEQGITVLPVLIVYETLFGESVRDVEMKCSNRKYEKQSDRSIDKCRTKYEKFRVKTNDSARICCYSNLIRTMIHSRYNCKLFTMFISILFVRCHLLHDLPKFSRFDNVLDSLPSPFKQLNCLYIWLFNIYKFLNPKQLACDWSAQSIELITSASPFIILLFLIYFVLFYICHQTILQGNFKLLFVAVLISNSGNSMMALQLFDQILKLDPKHEEALLTSARIIRKNSEFHQLHQVAIERLEKFVSLNQLDHSVFFELGMLYINFNIQKSIEYLQKAIQIKPDFSQALFNLSLLLYKQHRAQEAIPFLELLLKQDDSHQKAMILLFAINSSNQHN